MTIEHIDCLGREVTYVITFDEFITRFAHGNAHDFTQNGFLYDPVGTYAFDDEPVGFRSNADLGAYREWLSTHGDDATTLEESNRRRKPWKRSESEKLRDGAVSGLSRACIHLKQCRQYLDEIADIGKDPERSWANMRSRLREAENDIRTVREAFENLAKNKRRTFAELREAGEGANG